MNATRTRLAHHHARHLSRRLVLAGLVALLVVTSACSSTTATSGDASSGAAAGTTAPPPARPGGSLTVAIGGDTDGFSPFASQWSGSAVQMARTVLDPLVVMDRDNHWQPYLAKEITPNADFTVWTFELRPGVTFHNGERLDADALVAFFAAATSSPLSSQGFPEKPTIAKTDEMTVTLTFTQPWSQMPAILADQPGYVIAPAQIASGDSRHPIGTGPFVFDEWVPGKSLRVTRNAGYWRKDLPYLDRIEFRPISDPAARENALRSGEVDVIELDTVGQPKLDELATAGFRVVDDVDHVGVMNLLMNTDRPAVKDREVRRAIASAIDREAFRDTVLDGSFELADQPYPAGSKWRTDVEYPDYDPDRAKASVAAYEAEHGPLSISIMNVSGGPPTGAQFIQQQLAAVGIDARIDDVDLGRFIQRFVTGEFDTVYMGQFLYAADPDGSYPFLVGKNAAPETLIKLNFTRYRSDVVDQALAAQRRTDDDATRKAEWAKVWKALADDVPYAFLTYDRIAFVTKADVFGFDGFTTPAGVPLPAINHWTPFFTGVYRAPTS